MDDPRPLDTQGGRPESLLETVTVFRIAKPGRPDYGGAPPVPAGGDRPKREETMGVLAWLLGRRRPAARRESLQFVVYTRRGCHLCDAALERLTAARTRHGFGLTVVDVDTDPELVARYDTCVPVVTVNGKVRFRGVVNGVLLERLLRHAQSV
jgi:glutaredoxin